MPRIFNDPELNRITQRIKRAAKLERMMPQLVSLLAFAREAEREAITKSENHKWFEHSQIYKGRAAMAGAVRKKLEGILKDKQ